MALCVLSSYGALIMYITDETCENLKLALKQAFGVTLLCIFVKWSKCPFLWSVFMRDDFGQIFLKRLKRRM